MFDHVGVVVRDLAASRALYERLLAALDVRLLENHAQPDGTGWLVFGTGFEAPFFVVAAGRPTFWTAEHAPAKSPIHVAFRAPSRQAVDRFHAEGLRAGARDNGAPGVRRGRYYAAFLFDLDGNNVEAGVYA